MEDYKFLFKVVLVGNAGVGKTCLVRRFTQGMFPPGQGATIGVDFMIKTVEIDGEKIKVSSLYSVFTLSCSSTSWTAIFFLIVANMGHCRTGEIPEHNSELLQVGTCAHPSL